MRAKRESLAEAIGGLEQALSAEAAGREGDWAERMGRALRVLALAVRRHDANLESSDGGVVEIESAQSPSRTLDRQVTQLHQELEEALQGARALRAEACGNAFADWRAFRSRAGKLLSALRQYEEDEARLILECATTDLGAGD